MAVVLALSGCDGSSPDTNEGADVRVTADRVATFGIRALINAELQDRDASFLAYEGIRKSDKGWRMMLTGGTTQLEVEQRGDDLVIVGTSGLGAAARERQGLLGYREPGVPESPGFEFYDIDIASGPAVEASFFFKGPIPSSYAAECRVEIVGEGEELIYRGPVFSPQTPRSESARAGGLYSQPVPARAAAGRPRISCEDPQ